MLEMCNSYSSMMDVSIQRNPVLLVHGIWDTNAIFTKMSAYLIQQGWQVFSLNLIPNNGHVTLCKLAQQVANYANLIFGENQPFDLIGFSMGGIVSRHYVQRLGGIKRVQRLITISSPHHGTILAHSLPLPGYGNMCLKSKFLEDLNQDVKMLEEINFTSMWTPYDLMIVPASSSRMPVGDEVQVPVMLHAWMVQDPRCLQAVATALAKPLKIKAVSEWV
jgi:triacylglycerol lipase